MPSMNAEEIDALLVALRSLVGIEKPFGLLMVLAGLNLYIQPQHIIMLI